ncbi:MAG: putative transport system permease protein [Pseudonocardiales bacterium]|nr:putative transport system permease protein [Pseudonocardiales bacterium]
MSSTLAPLPPSIAAPPPARGGAPARRAIRRWAWRLLRREWRQQVLVLALLTVAVAATTVGLGLVVNVQGTDQGVFGTANARIDIGNPGPNGVAVDVAAARQHFGTVEAIAHASVPVPGSITPVDLRAQDPDGMFSKPMLRLVSGSYPVSPSEAAVTTAVATTFSLKVGSALPVNGRALRVVGIVENPKDLQDAFGLVAAGEISSPSSVTLLFDASGAKVMNFRPPAGSVRGIMYSGVDAAQQQRNQALAVLLLATIGLTFIGLLSVAGFTVMAQRRLRALGMIAAIGATDRQVRRVMMANGAGVGVVGAITGAALGLAVWFALTPAFEKVVGHRYDPFALPWWAVIAGAVLAILTALAASWWPARAAAKLPIVAALSGRPAPPQPVHRFALLGTVLAATGFVALILAHAVHTVLIVAGILATTAGMLLLAPLGIRALAALAGRAPIAVRLALRDLARYQARSGAALAAASLAIGIAATIAVTAAAQQAHDHTLTGGNLPTNQLIVWLANPNNQGGRGGPGLSVAPAGGGTTTPFAPNPAVVASARSTADAIAQALGTSTRVELDAAVDLNAAIPAGAPPGSGQANLVRPITYQGQHGFNQLTTPYVASAAVLGFYKIASTDISASSDIVTARSDLTGSQLGTGFGSRDSRDFYPITAQVAKGLPNYTSAPNTLITQKAMTVNGYTAEPVGWLVQAKQPITSAQITDARHRAAAAGITIETRTGRDRTLQHLRDYSTGAGVLVALGVLAMTVGLIRSETAGDLRTLAATGASSATRRTLNAASAAALALLGGILGTATAYLALIAWHWHDISYLNRPPYPHLAVLILGLPAVAAAGAWILGRTPNDLSRRRLE